MRRFTLALTIAIGVPIVCATQESHGQLLDRLKAKNSRTSSGDSATSPARPVPASPVSPTAVPQTPAPVAAKTSPVDGSTKNGPGEVPTHNANLPPAAAQTKSTAPPASHRTKTNTASAEATTPAISIETTGPAEINIGRRASFTIHLRNHGDSTARDLVVQSTLPEGAEFVHADPKPEMVNDMMQFSLKELSPKSERQIKIDIIPQQRGALDFKTHALVSTSSNARIQVRRPELTVQFAGPAETVFGEIITFKATITNTGDGVAENVCVAHMLPVQHGNGEFGQVAAVFEQAAGISQLLPGQSQEVELPAVAESEGMMRAQIQVSAADGLEVRAAADVRVRRPSIQLSAIGPGSRSVQRAGGYVIFVANTGELPISNAVVTAVVPQGLGIAAIQKGSTFDKKSNTLTWRLDKLEPNSTQTLKFQAKALAEGEQIVQITVVGDHAIRAETAHVTRVTGRAQLDMTIDEQAGPIEVGTPTEYGIRVKNCGTKPAQNLKVRAELPSGIEVVPSDDIRISGNIIEFAAIDELAVGDELVLSLKAVASEPGDHVIRFTLQSKTLSHEISAETSTLYYESKK